MIQDGTGEKVEYFDEVQLLWGSRNQPEGQPINGFQLMREGAQGLLHAPPVAVARAGKLMTRNYIDFDGDGCAYVKASRLVAVSEGDSR